MDIKLEVKDSGDSTFVSSITELEAELSKILIKVHLQPQKREIDRGTAGRLKIACPYCGDSAKSYSKKRGMIYLDTGTYKCWNGGCGKWSPLKDFFEDFNSDYSVHIKDFDVEGFVSSSVKTQNVAFSIFDVYDIKDKLIPRRDLMKKMGLCEVIDSHTTYEYLKGRKVNPKDNRLAVNPRTKDIVFFNMSASGKVLGLQIRKHKPDYGSPRFVSFSYGDILKKIMKLDDIDEKGCEKVKRISLIYNILQVDLSLPLNVFESTIDSHHTTNAIACWGTNSILKLDNARYFMDSDVAGKKISVELLKEGKNVFLWGLFKRLNPSLEGVKDINDIFKRGLKSFDKLTPYLSSNKLDITNI